jgi:hypothetical protein
MPHDKDREPSRNRPEYGHNLDQEQLFDLAWIEVHLSTFATVAREQFARHGRGVIVVDVNMIVLPTVDHLVWYLPQSVVAEIRDSELLQEMVREYPPEREMVIVLLKAGGKIHMYRMMMPPAHPHLN